MDGEQKKVTNIYAMLCVSLMLSFLPMATAAGLSLMMFAAVLIAAYTLRGRAPQGSLVSDHMTYIIRTLWISGFFALVTMTIACIYVIGVYDPSSIEPCAEAVMNATDQAAVKAAFQPCFNEFMSVNMKHFLVGAIIGAGPIVIYLAYRIAKGVTRAIKGHRIGDIKAWF